MSAELLQHFTGCNWKNKLQESFKESWRSQGMELPTRAGSKVSQGTRGLRTGLLTPSWEKCTQIMKGSHQSYAVKLSNFKTSSKDGAEPAFRPPATPEGPKLSVSFSYCSETTTITQSTGIKPLFSMTGEKKSKKPPLTQFTGEKSKVRCLTAGCCYLKYLSFLHKPQEC